MEIDRDLSAHLSGLGLPNVRVVEGDILGVSLDTLRADAAEPWRVVGNLPYNISSPILFMLLRTAGAGGVLADATLMLQREVADRLVARPGTSEYGTLAVQVGLHADVDRLLSLPPGAFRPPPKVHSAVVRLRFRPPAAEVGDPRVFETLVRGLFAQRRKTLANALKPLAAGFAKSPDALLSAAGIDGRRRPETLHVEEFARLAEVCYHSAASR